MTYEELLGLKQYVGFGDESVRALVHLHAVAEPCFEDIVDDFYTTIQEHSEAQGAISGGEAQVKRLKQTLVGWLHSTLLGPHDEDYLIARSRIGEVHVRIRLPERFMFSAMNRIRDGLLNVVYSRVEPEELRQRTSRAVHQILDIELAIMLNSYREHWVTRARNNERLATIGQLAASIAHELRNPLGIVQSSLYLLDARFSKLQLADATLDKHLARISTQVTACGNAISGLLEMARDGQPNKAPTKIRAIVDAGLESVAIPESVKVEIHIAPDLSVSADAQQLKQVVSNLVDNAITAMEKDGTITISAGGDERGVELLVADDGPGVALDMDERIFEVLFTTHAHGTGLGLALCRKIAQGHDGELTLVRRDEPGACFRLWLPTLAV